MNQLTVMFDPIGLVFCVYWDGLMIEAFTDSIQTKNYLEETFAPPVDVEWCFKEKE